LSPGVGKKGINLVPFKVNAVFIKAFFGHGKMSRQTLPRWVYLNLFGNFVLFMPFGFFFAGFLAQSSFRSSYRVVVLSGCLLSLGLEVFQLFIPTRATDIDDVIFNTVGTCLGVMMFFMLRRVFFAMYPQAVKCLKSPANRVGGT
jgi:glycopeptide antibiotics resistance protein